MTDVGVEAHLELIQQDRTTSIRAYVAAVTPRPLRWQLTTTSRTPSGTSNVTQAGRTQGQPDRPVSEVSVSSGSEGTVVLIVFDGAKEVACEVIDLGIGKSAEPN
ncbi:curli-like amyloid fiber formation chaperone CsgH [Brevundimonas variabilis]|uniref:Curli assembly protein CsgC n=1 Tax=Brevundimonas variabilis TaxID=74312 RepID=A0A7W9FG63_9CAUL|nr:curli-like amyloid fiber formation chaperone CsgH [Brevundimonas variabilis]MBB5746293.1 hypothetical protein [Brevundimonas variabilis]